MSNRIYSMNTRPRNLKPVAGSREIPPRSGCLVQTRSRIELEHYPKPSLLPLILAALLIWSAVGAMVWILYTLNSAA